jgi:uncharacterized membrane protein (DUF2068 family)
VESAGTGAGVTARDRGRVAALTIQGHASQLNKGAMPSEAIHAGKEAHQAEVTQSAPEHLRHDRGLLLIGLFKLGKALFFLCIGAGALHFLHKDLGDTLLRIAQALGRDPESRLVEMMMAKVDLIDHHRLRQISMFSIGYAGVALTEGIGLMLEKTWAEYLTLGLTISFLPWELYELARDATWFRVGLLLINLVVLLYLLWLLRRRRGTA